MAERGSDKHGPRLDDALAGEVREVLDRLPYDRDYANVNDAWTAAGGGQEEERF